MATRYFVNSIGTLITLYLVFMLVIIATTGTHLNMDIPALLLLLLLVIAGGSGLGFLLSGII